MINIFLLLSLFTAPFWLTLILLIFGLLMIPYYIESIIAFFFLELLYYGTMSTSETLFFYTPVIIAALFFAVQGLRFLAREHIFRF